MALADETRKPDRSSVDERHAPTAAVHAEDGVPGGDSQVAPKGELQSAGDGMTLDGGNDRLAEQHARRAHRPFPDGKDAVALPAGHRFQAGTPPAHPTPPAPHAHPPL